MTFLLQQSDKSAGYQSMMTGSGLMKVGGLSLVLLLAACSTDQRYKRQVEGDESYLKAPPSKPLVAPAGITLPTANKDYIVPATANKGQVGKQLDIRPPVQPLALVSGSRVQASSSGNANNNVSTLMFEDNAQNSLLWPNIVSVLETNKILIVSRDDAQQTLTTDWVKWTRADEDNQYQGRYQINLQRQGYQLALTVKLLGLQQQDKDVVVPFELQRYNGMMLNTITEGLEKASSKVDSHLAQTFGELAVQSANDDTGLPILVVRAPFGIVWQRLPAALEKAGMKVTDTSRNKGNISVTYSAKSSNWSALGVIDPGLKEGQYQLQVGDLDNRTSLQFTDDGGHQLDKAHNDALVSVLKAAFKQSVAR